MSKDETVLIIYGHLKQWKMKEAIKHLLKWTIMALKERGSGKSVNPLKWCVSSRGDSAANISLKGYVLSLFIIKV